MSGFTPTPESIPPSLVNYRQNPAEGVPVHIHSLNPPGFVLRAAQIYPDKVALVHPDVEHPVVYTYAVWAQRIQNLAYALIGAGIQPGDRVAVIAPNSPLIADAHQGILAARAVITPINTRLTPHEVAYILDHSGSKFILVDHQCAHLVPREFVAKYGEKAVVLSRDTGRVGDPYEAFLSDGRRSSGERGWTGLETERDEDAPASLCYTSGTTGRPKGVVSTLRGSYLGAVGNAFEARMSRDSTYLWILPMFHACGWTYPWACTFAFATQITLRTVDNAKIWKHFLNSGVTHYCGAPTVQIGIVNDPAARRLSRPISAIIAGSAPTAHLIGELEKINISAVHVYGLTYTLLLTPTDSPSDRTTLTPGADLRPFMRSYVQPHWAALPLAERAKLMSRQGHQFATALEVRVVHPASDADPRAPLEDVPRDGATVGEIVTRGNITMKEYYRDPEATRKAFRGGAFNSGDLAVMHPDGTVSIMDRSKDIIISGGENASSLAIEQELATHPDVFEVSVVARAHPRWGERPMAFVILRPSAAEKWRGRHAAFGADLAAHARTRLPGFACPEWVQVVDALPKTSTGKIQKMHLRKIVAKL